MAAGNCTDASYLEALLSVNQGTSHSYASITSIGPKLDKNVCLVRISRGLSVRMVFVNK